MSGSFASSVGGAIRAVFRPVLRAIYRGMVKPVLRPLARRARAYLWTPPEGESLSALDTRGLLLDIRDRLAALEELMLVRRKAGAVERARAEESPEGPPR